MKIALLLFFIVNPCSLYSQKICACKQKPWMSESVSCETRVLRNGSKLYYQYNCDRVWLTLENATGVKKVIYSSKDTDLFGYNYRLGYQLTNEFEKSLLFRYGCTASLKNDCFFVLIDKVTGRELASFTGMIYDGDDSLTDFIVYFTDEKKSSLTLNFIDKNKKIKIPIAPKRFNYAFPPSQFALFFLSNKIIKMPYSYYEKNGKEVSDTIIVDLKKY